MVDPLKDSFDDYIEKFKHPFWSMTLNEAFESHLTLEAKLSAAQECIITITKTLEYCDEVGTKLKERIIELNAKLTAAAERERDLVQLYNG